MYAVYFNGLLFLAQMLINKFLAISCRVFSIEKKLLSFGLYKKLGEGHLEEANAEAIACKNDLGNANLEEPRALLSNISNVGILPKHVLPGAFYILGFDKGRFLSESDFKLMKQLLPQVERNSTSFNAKELAIISAAMHRAQIAVTNQTLLKSLLAAICSNFDSSQCLRILKLLDLSVRRSIPPEALPNDDQLYSLASSLSRLLDSNLPPLYATRVMRFWQKLKITTDDIEKSTTKYFENLNRHGNDRPLATWRVKDLSQAIFTCGFFNQKWSKFSDNVLEEIDFRLSAKAGKKYLNELSNHPESYISTIFGLFTIADCPTIQADRLKRLVASNEIFQRAPTTGARSVEAWQSIRVCAEVTMTSPSNIIKFSTEFQDQEHQRLTGRQYMALQIADSTKQAFPNATVHMCQLLSGFATDAKLDILIDNLEFNGTKYKVSLLPLPELACFRRLVLAKSSVLSSENKLVSIYYPQGSEMLRLKCIESAGLVNASIPILWPTWRSSRVNNRHSFIRNIVLAKLKERQK